MKVSITHSIDLEEVPEKASELLIPVEEKLADTVRWLNNLCRDLSRGNMSSELAALSVERIRRTMGEGDVILGEVENILQGVADYEKSQALPPIPPAPLQPSDDFKQMMDDMDEEKKQLAEDMLRGLKERQDESSLPI